MNFGKSWVILILVVSIASLCGELYNDKFKMLDFEVYYKTASRILNHAELYSIPEDGHYVYKYSPVAGLFFIPFALLNYSIAAILYWTLLTALLVIALKTFFNLLDESNYSKGKNSISKILILSILVVIVHVHRELHLGQVNMLLLIIYIFMLNAYFKKQGVLFAILLSISIFIKPFGLIFFPYLVLKKDFRIIGYSILVMILLLFTPIIFYPSIDQLWHLYNSWWNELSIELSAKQNLLADSNHTVFSVIARFTPLKSILINSASQKIYQLIFIAGLALVFLKFSLNQHQKDRTVKEFSFLIALIPLLAFTSENAFIFELPVVVLLIYYFKIYSTFQKVFIVIGCILIGGNIYDLVGSQISNYLISISIYTFGSLFLLAILSAQRNPRSIK